MGTRTGDGGFVSWQELGSDAIAQACHGMVP